MQIPDTMGTGIPQDR